ncbi:hypothetical protein V6U81_09225 [Micromonospora sp. CPCC 205711]|uniref:hypothetical protein n=1 Tax=Micromonospora sp. CPCC 205547 TaxID=3122400 RepID=UPI002FEF21ED
MSTGKQPGAQPKKSGWPALIWTIVLVVLCCGGTVVYPSWGTVFGDDRSATVSAPTAQERGDTVPILAQSAAGQGVCYGWVLKDYFDYGDPVSVGSNLGDGVAVQDNPACPRWVQVSARIYYPSKSSESDDNAYVDVTGSADVDSVDLLRMKSGLDRLGVTEKAFVDDPGWAITRAAVMLPLLAAEQGLVEPAATPAPDTASPSPLPAAGNDLWRDRWGYFVAVTTLVLIAALLITVGVVQRRRQRRRVAVPAQRAGAEPATTRTPERG